MKRAACVFFLVVSCAVAADGPAPTEWHASGFREFSMGPHDLRIDGTAFALSDVVFDVKEGKWLKETRMLCTVQNKLTYKKVNVSIHLALFDDQKKLIWTNRGNLKGFGGYVGARKSGIVKTWLWLPADLLGKVKWYQVSAFVDQVKDET